MESRLYADTDLPLLIFGDFYCARKEEQNKFILDVCSYLGACNTLVHDTG